MLWLRAISNVKAPEKTLSMRFFLEFLDPALPGKAQTSSSYPDTQRASLLPRSREGAAARRGLVRFHKVRRGSPESWDVLGPGQPRINSLPPSPEAEQPSPQAALSLGDSVTSGLNEGFRGARSIS